ncbi:MAG: transcription elongation factor GreA [Candidatus Levybacteria bacterium RIFCSPHIGHO2_12_FULL_38_12]|nr:MAG: transcription elongation factor GreA [Candidatus Levybacteria bacterium RIFCSPHIGHO2_12_FULL_38_12]OGH34027.1 MAG: transcription elongation factor GreA [Candidatus Levybacteria bacterium RIFCSPLOWO2_01_FULL_37_20]OGH44886.1 MAG: transcription elongation factor GreA [Candidatus Levybacteria bacterium RIFCSPLOWO2_02_FULL_37_18]
MDKKIYLTKDGLEELKKEYEGLTKVRRPEIVTRVSDARNLGDLSENAEYVAAREELSFIDGRIDELEELLKQATLIQQDDSTKKNRKKVIKLGSRVILSVKGKREEFTIVGEWEADPTEKKISHESPLGKALLGKQDGEKIEVEAPAGKILYTVLSVN